MHYIHSFTTVLKYNRCCFNSTCKPLIVDFRVMIRYYSVWQPGEWRHNLSAAAAVGWLMYRPPSGRSCYVHRTLLRQNLNSRSLLYIGKNWMTLQNIIVLSKFISCIFFTEIISMIAVRYRNQSTSCACRLIHSKQLTLSLFVAHTMS